MSLTRKKVHLNDYLQLSLTQKLRDNPSRSQFRRKCCQKQNDHCKEGRQCRAKQESKSMKKLMKKKYLQEEVEKLLQKRVNESDQKINLLKEKNSNEIEGLREDLKQMKDVIFKLTYDEGKGKKEDEEDEREEQFNLKCIQYEKKIDQLKKELEKAYLKVRETQKKCGEQLTKISNLKKEGKDYCRKIQILKQAQQASTKNQQNLQLQLQKAIQNEKILKQKAQIFESQIQNLKMTLISKNSCLQAKQKEIVDLTTKLQGVINSNELTVNTFKAQKQKEIFELKEQFSQAKQALRSQSQARSQLQNTIQKMNQQLKSTSIDLGNTKVKLTVLSSMEKKCEELFDQIKREKQKWTQYTLETSNERQNFEKRIQGLEQIKRQTEEQLTKLQKKQGQLLLEIKRLEGDNKRLFQDKINLAKQVKLLQQNLNQVTQEKRNSNIKVQLLKKQSLILQETLKEKEKQWKIMKLNQQKKIQSLQNEKYAIQKEINKNLQNTKNQINQLQSQATSLHNQVDRLTDQKEILNQNFRQLLQKVIDNEKINEKLKETLKQKNQSIQVMNLELDSYKNSTILCQKRIEQTCFKAEGQYQCMKNRLQSQLRAKQEQINSLEKEYDLLKKNLQQSVSKKENQIHVLNQKLVNTSTDLTQTATQLKNMNKQLINEQQKNQKLSNDLGVLMTKLQQSKLNLSRIENHGRHTVIELENKYHNVNVRLQFYEKQADNWKNKSLQLQQSFLIEKTKRQQYELKWSQSESIRLSLSSELSQLISNTKRSQEQISLYEREISLKNKSISQLKQIIKVVKNQSLLIKEEVDSYRIQFQEVQMLRQQETNRSNALTIQYQELQRLTLQQVKYMRQRLEDLDFDKKDLSIQIVQLNQKNIELQERLKEVNIELNWREQSLSYQSQVCQLKQIIEINKQQYDRMKNNLQTKLENLNRQLEMKGRELQMLAKMLEDQRCQSSQKLRRVCKEYETTKSILQQQNAISQKLAKIIEQKQEVIKQLTEKSNAYQSKKNTIRSQVHSIQNQISLLSDRNISLQEANQILQAKVREFEEKQKLYEQKLCTIIQNKYLVQQRKGQLEQQINMLQQQLYKSQQKQKSLAEQSERKIKEAYQICQRRREDIVKQLTINLNSKQQQATLYVRKNAQMQEVLRENHQFLENEKSTRQRLQIQIVQLRNELDKVQIEISSVNRNSQCLARDKAIAKQRLAEIQNRYLSVVKKFQTVQLQKGSLIRQLQNNQMTIRVLREQNGSIEKVMSQQINQHKSIIQQLVNEKRLLYSQFQHQ